MWLIDDLACGILTKTRQVVGIPLAFLFELHGWYVVIPGLIQPNWKFGLLIETRWHVFTAIGGYVAVAVVDQITSGEVHQNPTRDLAWPIPPVARLIETITADKKQI